MGSEDMALQLGKTKGAWQTTSSAPHPPAASLSTHGSHL